MAKKKVVRSVTASLAALLLTAGVIMAATSAISVALGKKHLQHQKHDPLLGWINIPGTTIPDMYGPGKSLKINSQSFRNDQDFLPQAPPRRVRVVCSGDSMTFGYGVGNDHAWCQALASLDPRLQTVNLGHIGYGLDQMFLWYMRAGSELDHSIHILALSEVNLERLARTGIRPKPKLRWVGDGLVVENFPVPEPSPWRVLLPLRIRKSWGSDDHELAATLAAHILESLARESRARGRLLMVAYLPILAEVNSERTGRWPRFLSSETEKMGIPFVDLTVDFRRLPLEERRRLFLKRESSHYGEEGNRFVAAAIHARLSAIPWAARRNRLRDSAASARLPNPRH